MSSASANLAHQAIAHDEADAAFAPLAQCDGLLIAVSGGPDSLALLYLLADWAARRLHIEPQRPAPQLYAATVDHCLRAGSAAEAALVADHCAKLSIPHATLVWNAPKPWSGVAQAARQARYALLRRHAENVLPPGRRAVVTGHTLDDQAETLLMRLQRGSGVEGLAAMRDDRAIAPASDVHLMRPLLAMPKTRLTGTLQARGILWCDDPTNDDVTTERVRLRKTLALMRERGFTVDALARTARRMQVAADALTYAERVFRQTLLLVLHDGVGARLDRAAFDAVPLYLRQRTLAKLIAGFGSPALTPELGDIEALVDRLERDGTVGATLGGAMLTAGPRAISVYREFGRIAPAAVALVSGQPVLWDDRFWVTVIAEGVSGLTVSALGEADYRAVVSQLPDPRPLAGLPAAALYGLPALRAGQALLAVPPLGLVLPETTKQGVTAMTCQPISAATLND